MTGQQNESPTKNACEPLYFGSATPKRSMKRKYILAPVLLIVGFILGYSVSSKRWNTYSWASSQNGMLIPLFEYYRPSAVGNEEEKMNQTYHLTIGVLFGDRYLSDRGALDEANTHILIEKILESRLARGLPIIEESLLPNATRTSVLENFYGNLDHIEFDVEPGGGINSVRSAHSVDTP